MSSSFVIADPISQLQVHEVTLGERPLTISEVVAVARHYATVSVSQTALDNMTRTRAIVDALADSKQPVYGISTGFGALATQHISADKRALLQLSLIRSHAAGSGSLVRLPFASRLFHLMENTT
jgi:histidine ammonia-lyase